MVTMEQSFRNNMIKISAVGDIMLGMGYLQSYRQPQNILNRLMNEPKSIFKNIQPIISKSDIVFGNLECPISNDFSGNFKDDPKFIIAPSQSLKALNYGNFHILNLANNHILDHGLESALETKKLLEMNNIKTIGSPDSSINEMVISSIKNKKIGFLGFNLCPVGGKQTEVNDMINSIKYNRNCVDIMIVSVHWGWGYEHMHTPSPNEIKIGHEIINNGADIVLGHHSHVLQPIELYKDKIIAYSLGNCIFDMWRKENRVGGVLEILIDAENNLSANILPFEQINFQIKMDIAESDQFNNSLIVDKIQSEPQYYDYANKKRKSHQREVIKYYLTNFYRLPLKINIFYLKNLMSTITERLIKQKSV